MTIPRSEYPNPQLERADWVCLNGEWDFGFEKAKGGFRFSKTADEAVRLFETAAYPYKINVPFCLESALSGVGYKRFVHRAWYRRTVEIQKDGRRVFLRFGAADYLTTVLVNGKPAGRHTGGYTSFSFEITDLVRDGENELFVLCEDNVKDPLVMRGKQCEKRFSCGCDYTRTTGVWQTVWLEYTPRAYLQSVRYYPDPADGSLTVFAAFCGEGDFSCTAYYNGKAVGAIEPVRTAGTRVFRLVLDETHLWEPGCGRLYDLTLRFGSDEVKSYFGLRSVRMDEKRFLLNEQPVFQRLVLDQGFYPDGIYTAPDEDALVRDIELSMAAGFNGARLHQKVFEPRFLYHCDRLGYLVWGEYPNWGLDYSDWRAIPVFLAQWREALERDINHPAVIGWCPFNETWDYRGRRQNDELLAAVYDFTKAFDCTRPCIDTSGSYHVKTDIYDVHDYDHDPRSFRARYDAFAATGVLEEGLNREEVRQTYRGEPVMMSEYGGIKWESDRSVASWGYGESVKTPAEFLARYQGLTAALTDNGSFFGFCYTQLYDIEQEQNGLYTYDRQKKFDDEIYAAIKAANEKRTQ